MCFDFKFNYSLFPRCSSAFYRGDIRARVQLSSTKIQTRDSDHDQNVTIDALDRSANDPATKKIILTRFHSGTLFVSYFFITV